MCRKSCLVGVPPRTRRLLLWSPSSTWRTLRTCRSARSHVAQVRRRSCRAESASGAFNPLEAIIRDKVGASASAGGSEFAPQHANLSQNSGGDKKVVALPSYGGKGTL